MRERVGQQLGNYRLIRHLGQGSFADVYLGEHVHLRTQAAIKILHALVGPDEHEQFLTEGRTIAHLEHPHIVPVLDYGIDEQGAPFLVMVYAPGGTLRDRHPAGQALSLATILPYVEQIAQALDYIHAQKLVHRDVKPANVLLRANGMLLLSDFGLVSITRATGSLTNQTLAGTPAYMAPEQFQQRSYPASDQYALAIMVYEWLCGRRPFQGAELALSYQHVHTPPPPLRNLVPTIPPTVEAVVLKALAKDPQLRFQSVQALADALKQASLAEQSGSLVSPHAPVSPPQGGALSPTLSAQQAGRPGMTGTHPSQHQPMTTVSGNWRPNQPVARTDSRDSQADWSALTPAGQFEPVAPPSRRQNISRRTIVLGLGILTLGACGTITLVSQASSGSLQRLFASIFGPSPKPSRSTQPDQGTKPSPSLGTILLTYRDGKRVWGAAWSPNGRYIASGDDDPVVKIWDAKTGASIFTYHGHVDKTPAGYTASIESLAWSPDGSRIVSAGAISKPGVDFSNKPEIQVWKVGTGELITTYSGHDPRPGHANVAFDAEWSPDGKRIVTAGGWDQTVQVWDATTGATFLTLRGHTNYVMQARWSPDGKYIASRDALEVRVWDTNGKLLTTYANTSPYAYDMTWLPDSKHVASAGYGQIDIWEAVTGRWLMSLPGSDKVAWSPDSKFMATLGKNTSTDHTQVARVVIVETQTGKQVYTFSSHTDQINAIAWSPDSARIASGGLDAVILVWQAEKEEPLFN